MTNPDAAVCLDGVSKTFGKHRAVADLSLTVPRGAIYGFIGPNGSGKTTTIRMILRIFLPDTGSVSVLGERVSRTANDRVGYLPEERGLYKKWRVSQVLGYYGALKGMERKRAAWSGAEWLERMSLSEWANKKVETLSKGMAQKVQFISAVIARPDLLILDEPFSGLDPVNLDVLREAIVGLRDQGTTIIFSTHDMATAEDMCDSIFMIYKGRKVLDGSLAEIQATYGLDTVRIRAEGVGALLRDHPLVEHMRDLGQSVEARCAGDPQDLLKFLTTQTAVTHFEIARPSLHDIFVRIARPQTEEDTHE